jgi:hypothetical protein
MSFITFDSRSRGRTGNVIIQYLMCKVLEIKIGHKYISFSEFEINIIPKEQIFIFNDENIEDIINNKNNIWEEIKKKHLIGEGYFQKSDFFIKDRDILLEIIYNNENMDYWIFENKKIFIKDFLFFKNNFNFNENDVVISLRLDDFIQVPCETSDILPPTFYTNILDQIKFEKLYIVCDKLRFDWEYKYLDIFKKWNPILIQGSIIHDMSIIRDCKILIHSNSTFCWIMSFFSKTKLKRFIPYTNFYKGQKLFKIYENDSLYQINPLSHKEVYEIHK